MFRSRAAALDWEPREGMQVEVRALPTLYEPRGRFQLTVEGMRRAGLGPLYERFLRLKEQARREGLFDADREARAAALPRPHRRGDLARRGGAARRADHARAPQSGDPGGRLPGAGAGRRRRRAHRRHARARQPARRVRRAAPGARRRLDRGPVAVQRGSAWRAPSAPPPSRSWSASATRPTSPSPTSPPTSARRRRPPPPSWPARRAPSSLGAGGGVRSAACPRDAPATASMPPRRSTAAARRLVHPAERLRSYQQLMIQLSARLAFAFSHRVHRCQAHLAELHATLVSLDPTAVLERGYSITTNASGEVLRDASARARPGERLQDPPGARRDRKRSEERPDGPSPLEDHHAHRRQGRDRPGRRLARAEGPSRASTALGDVDELNSALGLLLAEELPRAGARGARSRCSRTCSTSAAS